MWGAGWVGRLVLAPEDGANPGRLDIRGPRLDDDIDNEDVNEACPPKDPKRFTGDTPMLLPMLLPLPIELREAHRTVSNTFL